MPSRYIKLLENQIYHVYNRSVNKKTIFFVYNDYKKFVENMVRYNKIYKWIKVYSRSVMPNHFHLVLSSSNFWKEISDFMRRVQQSYAVYFKRKYKNISPDMEILKYPKVFESRFKAKYLRNEKYLNQAIYYVAMNPLKHWIVDKIEDWIFTAYHEISVKWVNLDVSFFNDWEF